MDTANPNRRLAAVLLAALCAGVAGADDPKDASAAANRRYAVAVGFQSRQLPKLAAEEWRKFLAEFPKDPRQDRAHHYLGACLLQDGQLDAAVTEFQGVLDTFPKYDQRDSVALNLGVARLRRGAGTKKPEDFDAAIRAFEAVPEGSPQRPRALLYRAETLAQAGKADQAADAYARLVKDHPKADVAAEATYAIGVAQDAKKQPEAASATFAEFVRKFPDHPLADECRLRQAEALFAQKKGAEAEPLYAELASAQNFAYADFALLRQAACVLGRGKAAEAAALDLTLPQKFPKSKLVGAARLAAGKALLQAEKPGAAREALAPVVREKLPEGAEAAYWTARAFLKDKDPARAVEAIQSALSAYPEGPTRPLLEFARADALAEIPNRRAEAASAYAAFARARPADPQAPQALYLAAHTALGLDQPDVVKEHASAFAASYPNDPLRPEVEYIAAEAELRARRWHEAASRFADLSVKWPQSPHVEEARVRRALAQSMQAKYDQAVDALTPFLATFKDKALLAHAQYLIGRARAEQGRTEPAIAALNASLAAKGDWAQADETLLTLAHCYRARNQTDEAAASLTKLLGSFPKSPLAARALYLLAECELGKDRLDPALGHYREAASKAPGGDPTGALAQFGVARALYRKGDWNGTVDAVGVLARKAPKSDILPRALYARALAERKLKRDADAAKDVQAFLASNPGGDEALDARLVLGLCQASLGRNQDAADTLSKLLKDHPNYPQADQARYELAFALKALKRDQEAADVFRQLATSTPSSPLAAEGSFRAGDILYASGRYEEAAKSYAESLARSPSPVLKEKALHKLGWCAYQRNDFAAAVSAFDRQAAEFPAGPLAQDGLFLAAESEFKRDRWQPAFDRYLKIVRSRPPAYHARALYRAGQCAGLLKDWSAAVAQYEDLLATFPQFDRRADAHYGLGLALQNLDRLPQAVAAYEQAVKETDTETAAKAQFMTGECLFAQKKHEEAAAQFLKAAYGYPYEEWAGNAHFEAARCFEVLRKFDQARRSYEALAQKYPNHPKAKAAAERLKDLPRDGP